MRHPTTSTNKSAAPTLFQDPVESLSCTVGLIRTLDDAEAVLRLRTAAYSRHAYREALISTLSTPDAADLIYKATTFIARCKRTRAVVGSLRLTTNLFLPDALPAEVPDQPWLIGTYAYMDRFVTSESAAADVVPALSKASWLWCQSLGIDWQLALAQAPLVRHYQKISGMSIVNRQDRIFLHEYSDRPYYFMALPTKNAEQLLGSINPNYLANFVQIAHKEIQVVGVPTFSGWGEFVTRPVFLEAEAA